MEYGKRKVCIVGGGLAGPMMAIILAQKGYEVKVFERRADMRKTQISAGRSINLALSVRGFHALEQIGLKESLMKISIPMIGRTIHDIDETTHLQRYGKDDTEAIYSVSRGALNCALMDLCETFNNISFHFNTTCTKYDTKKNIVHFTKDDRKFEIADHLVISADGYSSAIRDSLMQRTRMNYSQVYETHGYKELTLPPGPNDTFQIDRNSLHIWPRGGFMLIALPNLDGNFTCTLFLAHENDKESFDNLKSDDDILNFFKKYFPDAVKLMPDLVQQFKQNPIGNLCTVKVNPWNFEDNVVLIGDSAHALVPFYGQGMNCAFEDCIVFSQMLEEQNQIIDWKELLKQFSIKRRPDAEAIQDMAVENFYEMRDKVNDKFFKLKKECEIKIAKRFPDFIPRYSLVSFSRVPYSQAKLRGQIHETVLNDLCKNIKESEEFNEEQAYNKIIEIYKERGFKL